MQKVFLKDSPLNSSTMGGLHPAGAYKGGETFWVP